MPLVDDLRQIINQTRNRVAVNVNAELTIKRYLETRAPNTENKLCRQCRHNCSQNSAKRDLNPVASGG